MKIQPDAVFAKMLCLCRDASGKIALVTSMGTQARAAKITHRLYMSIHFPHFSTPTFLSSQNRALQSCPVGTSFRGTIMNPATGHGCGTHKELVTLGSRNTLCHIRPVPVMYYSEDIWWLFCDGASEPR